MHPLRMGQRSPVQKTGRLHQFAIVQNNVFNLMEMRTAAAEPLIKPASCRLSRQYTSFNINEANLSKDSFATTVTRFRPR